MEPELAAFLNSRVANFFDTIDWPESGTRLKLQGFLSKESPPDRFVLAGRAIVVRSNEVLLIETPYGNHVLPGGRREEGETTTDAIHRELIEETGWLIRNLMPFAILHLHYETPVPRNVGRVIYPDFIWHVFTAEPMEFRGLDPQPDDREVLLGSCFKPIADVLKDDIDPFQKDLLTALAQRLSKGHLT